MELFIVLSISVYISQLVVLAVLISADIKYEGSLPKDISTKKQALAYIIPFGFLYAFYNYYKKLN